MEKNLSIVLIAHNEENNVGTMIDGLLKTYEKEILEIVVVDDASTDKTAAIIASKALSYPRVRLIKRIPPCGVGRALKEGFRSVSPKATYVLSMDSDFIENIPEVRALISRMDRHDCDGVIGSRFIKGSRMSRYPLMKKISNRIFHIIVKFIFGLEQNDFTNNFKLYKADIFRTMPWKSDDFAMNAETGLLPVVWGYKIVEVPISWIGRDHKMGQSKFKLLRHGIRYVNVIRYVRKTLREKKAGYN